MTRLHDNLIQLENPNVKRQITETNHMHIFTLRVCLTWLPRKTMVMSLEHRDILAKTLNIKVIIKDHGPLLSLELPTRNDLIPRCCLQIYDDGPFEMLRYPYMLPSETIRPFEHPFKIPTTELPTH